MIPLRKAFIVKMHGRPGQPGTLLYPEGTACAQVLISGEKGGTTGRTVFTGFGLAFLHKFLVEGMSLFAATAVVPVKFINKAANFAADMASLNESRRVVSALLSPPTESPGIAGRR